MSQQLNIRVLEGVAKRFELALRSASGAPLPAAEWQLGGGAENSSGDKVDATVVEFADGRAVLQLPPLTLGPQKVCKPRREPWGYQLRATETATGRVYVLLQGELTVDPWYGETEPSNGMVDAARVAADAALEDAEVVTGTITMGIAGPQGEQGPKGDKGDPGAALTYDDLTAAQKAELIAPLGYAEVDVAPEGTTEENYNAYGFGFEMPRAGRIKGLTLECRDNNTATPADTPVWLKVWRGTTLIARSENSQQHAVAAVLSYSFAEPFEVAEGEEIKVSFHAEEGLAETGYYMGRQCCLRVVAKDLDTPGGLLGAAGGYGSESDATQRSWQAKHTWHMLVGVFAPAEHVEDTTAHITEQERTTWNEAAAREVPEAYTLTAEEVRAVVPIAWQGTGDMPEAEVCAIAFGMNAGANGEYSIALGEQAEVLAANGIALGYLAAAYGENSIAIGFGVLSQNEDSIAVGRKARAQGGAGMALGASARATGDLSTALGPGAQATAQRSIAIGYIAKSSSGFSAAFGDNAEAAGAYSVAVGGGAEATGEYSVALGPLSEATARRSVAIGNSAKSQDDDLIVMSVGETTGGSIRTHFCFMGQGSPLANTYEGGEACMGYVVADGDGNIITSGTRKLSELFTNNVGTFCPTGFVLGTGPEPPIYD